MISCGHFFTVCVDCESFIWSFGANNRWQLGTGNRTDFNVPQKIEDIPPVISIFCGSEHTLIITNDNLWSCGRNAEGQLCHADRDDRSMLSKTSFSNISKISAGISHSLFQNFNGEIFACGAEEGLGGFNDQITPNLIHNVPPNIVHFVCGYDKSLFLDSEGNVFTVRNDCFGDDQDRNQNILYVLKKIPNIPPIKIISCVSVGFYLIDFERNLWSFGYNEDGQLGHGDRRNIDTPKVINTLKNIQQISYGSCGFHFITRNSQNQIFATGNNDCGQLGTGNYQSILIPTEINSKYSTIWGDEFFYTRAKSARK